MNCGALSQSFPTRPLNEYTRNSVSQSLERKVVLPKSFRHCSRKSCKIIKALKRESSAPWNDLIECVVFHLSNQLTDKGALVTNQLDISYEAHQK